MNSSAPDNSPPPAERLGHRELLAALIVLLVLQSFLSTEVTLQRQIMNALFLGLVLAAIRTLSSSRIRLVIAVSFGLIAYALSWIVEFYPSVQLEAATRLFNIVMFLALVLALCENVFRSGTVDMNRIIGAVNLFLVLGLLWAFVFALLETLQPGSLGSPNGDLSADLLSDLTYFSSVTLTTLGYGDIVPISRPARMLAALEATLGQVYLATVIARLVGLHISQGK